VPWIESHTVLSRHRKVKETARALRIRPAYLIGHLHLLWHAALEQAEDGDLTRWSDEFIAESADYPGDAPQFVQLLQDHGWLDGRLLHDWIDYAGKFLMGKYAGGNRERLVEIWAKHGRNYGKKSDPNPSPTESQPETNQTPSTPLGKVGGLDPGKGSAEGKPTDPDNVEATRATLRAAVACSLLENPEFGIAWDAFLAMRKAKKEPATPHAQKLLLRKLEAYSIETATKMVDESTINSWKGVFPLKDSPVNGKPLDAQRKKAQALP
jgi:hypothetical protein